MNHMITVKHFLYHTYLFKTQSERGNLIVGMYYDTTGNHIANFVLKINDWSSVKRLNIVSRT